MALISFAIQFINNMPKHKYYVVWKGRKTGVYGSWKECEEQVRGFDGAIYKSFTSQHQAYEAFGKDPDEFLGKNHKQKISLTEGSFNGNGPVWKSLSVDAACEGNPGILEYRGVWTHTGEEVFHGGPYPLGTVNLGEFLGIVHGLAFLQQQGNPCPVYSDSRTAIKWVKDKKIKTKLELTGPTQRLFEHICRALEWLRTNPYPNQVIKWDTVSWGEIPADFGRK